MELGSYLFAVMFPLHYYHQKHPVNLILLAIFTIAISFAVGMTCAFTSGNNAPCSSISLGHALLFLCELELSIWFN
jgi:hypothetical protein